MDRYEYTQEKVAEVVGKSRSSVAEVLRLRRIPDPVRELCREHGIDAKSVLVEISRLESADDMARLVTAIASGEVTDRAALRDAKRASRGQPNKPRSTVLRFGDRSQPYRLQLRFQETTVSREQVIAALEATLEKIRSGEMPLNIGGDQAAETSESSS